MSSFLTVYIIQEMHQSSEHDSASPPTNGIHRGEEGFWGIVGSGAFCVCDMFLRSIPGNIAKDNLQF